MEGLDTSFYILLGISVFVLAGFTYTFARVILTAKPIKPEKINEIEGQLESVDTFEDANLKES